MGVDIISMSWTFSQEGSVKQQRDEFESAILAAAKNKIILFNSLNDKKTADINNFFPLCYTEVIRIGSANDYGDKADFSKRGAAHYLFPGVAVKFSKTNGKEKGTEEEEKGMNGSSLATAFAAGLAGLIIYTARALVSVDNGLTETDLEKLKDVETRIGI